MQSRLIAGVYHPETLKRAKDAFDSAWACIESSIEEAVHSKARSELAKIILELAADHSASPLELKCRAIGEMRLPAKRGDVAASDRRQVSAVIR